MTIAQTFRRCLTLFLVVGALAACQTTRGDNIMMSQKGAVEMRAMQSRAFDTPDRYKTIRAIVATMQDLEEFTGVGRRKLRFHVGQLVRHEYLERHGMGRGTYYTVG